MLHGPATALCAFVLAGCALPPDRPAPAADPGATVAIVAAERGPRGIRLVAIDEHGDRRFELVAPPDVIVRDGNPAVSPDGRWLVFASTRGRTDGGTSLWIAPLSIHATPRRLTSARSIDQHPVWMPDGRAIVFASTRAKGDFDLWRLPLDRGRPGVPEQLTSTSAHEVMPTIAPDGTILYASITTIAPAAGGGGEIESHLEERSPDGTIRPITAGPADSSPALSPEGQTLIFVRPVVHQGAAHTGLWRIDRGAWRSRSTALPATPLVHLPITDETGPVWSRDGRFVFATSVLLGNGGKVVFSSIVHVDLHERTPRARILRERSGAVPRLNPAIRSSRLDAAALDADPEYLPELARIVAAAIASETGR